MKPLIPPLIAAWVALTCTLCCLDPCLSRVGLLSIPLYCLGLLLGRGEPVALATALQLAAVASYAASSRHLFTSYVMALSAIYLAELASTTVRARSCLDRGFVARRAVQLTLIFSSALALSTLLTALFHSMTSLELDFGEYAFLLLLLLFIAVALIRSEE